MKKSKLLIVGLICLLMAGGLILIACQQDMCEGRCGWNVHGQMYVGCDSISGGRCYQECAAYDRYMRLGSTLPDGMRTHSVGNASRCDCYK